MTVPEEIWRRLLADYVEEPLSVEFLAVLDRYLELLLRWNQRVNLTSVRDPEGMIQRHVGEGLFAERYVPRGTSTLLDHGSGAGVPGMPIALARPEIAITLSESVQKKAAFLREVSRKLGLNCAIHAARTENLPQTQQFDCVTMRAVDRAETAISIAADRVKPGGILLVLGGSAELPGGWDTHSVAIPHSPGFLRIARRNVPRGTSPSGLQAGQS